MLLVAVDNHIINFYLMFTLRYRQADIVATVSLAVSLLPAITVVIAGVMKSIKIRDKALSPLSTTPVIIYRW